LSEDPVRDPTLLQSLSDPGIHQEFVRRGGKLKLNRMRATAAAYILLPFVVGIASFLWVQQQVTAALVVLALFVAWNVWSGTQGQRDRSRNERILQQILNEHKSRPESQR
jgi:hypothetical protein